MINNFRYFQHNTEKASHIKDTYTSFKENRDMQINKEEMHSQAAYNKLRLLERFCILISISSGSFK